ncbi:hypothetical protein [Stappia sp. ES.058]|uniref:head-tail joining protein n=1 Tax=Stappia sp. ES.058 TaxID=1881061 RepID=UPI00087AE4A1|nr:hypothetical protein [Stappia sp. ES.058]SDT97041.1 hypothetical protein SAMN05428979_0808 [Stappia sp. ES.058]
MSREIALEIAQAAMAEFGIDGTYTPPGGAAVGIRFRLVRDGEEAVAFSERGPLGRKPEVRVLVDDLTPEAGGVFAASGQSFTVAGRPRKADRYRLVWTCAVDAR